MDNLEAEQYVLGTLMAHNEALSMIPDLKAEHFQDPAHVQMFGLIQQGIQSGRVVSPVTLVSHLGEESKKYLAKLAISAQGIISITSYADEITSLAIRRAMKEQANIALLSSNNDEIISALHTGLNIAAGASVTHSIKDARTVTHEIAADLEKRKMPDSTGILLLDEAMGGGMYPGKAYGVLARKKVGKTILASTLSYNLGKQDKKHLCIWGEMGSKEVHERCLARDMGIYPSAFRMGNTRPIDFNERLDKSKLTMPTSALYVDAPGVTFDNLKQLVAVGVAKHKIRGFVLDYWQLVSGGDARNPVRHLDEVAQWIATACKQYNIWALVMAQENQDGNSRGGEGIRLAFDQIYRLRAPNDDPSNSNRWLEMVDTRYTAWANVGGETEWPLYLNEKGPYFEQL